MAEREEIRLEALKGLTILAIHDDQFRSAVMEDLEGTLSRYGYALNDAEMERVRSAHEEFAGMTDADLARALNERRVMTEEEERTLSPQEFLNHFLR
jgi:hypothetical protein